MSVTPPRRPKSNVLVRMWRQGICFFPDSREASRPIKVLGEGNARCLSWATHNSLCHLQTSGPGGWVMITHGQPPGCRSSGGDGSGLPLDESLHLASSLPPFHLPSQTSSSGHQSTPPFQSCDTRAQHLSIKSHVEEFPSPCRNNSHLCQLEVQQSVHARCRLRSGQSTRKLSAACGRLQS